MSGQVMEYKGKFNQLRVLCSRSGQESGLVKSRQKGEDHDQRTEGTIDCKSGRGGGTGANMESSVICTHQA